MITDTRPVTVLVERRVTGNVWQPETWLPVAILPGAAAAAPWTVLAEGEGWTRYVAGVATLTLFSTETQNYKPTVEAERPTVYVVLRRVEDPAPGAPPLELHLATVDAGEAQAHGDTGDDILEALPMPAPILEWVASFVADHPVQPTFHKRRRDRADPEALARGTRRPSPGEDPEDD